MALLLALLAQVTRGGALAALVDPLDSLDPASAAASGVDLPRLLWLRGRRGGDEVAPKALAEATAAVATLAGSGLFDLVALDLVQAARALRGLPSTTWLRLQRLVEETPTALVLLGESHVACSPGGASLALEAGGACSGRDRRDRRGCCARCGRRPGPAGTACARRTSRCRRSPERGRHAGSSCSARCTLRIPCPSEHALVEIAREFTPRV